MATGGARGKSGARGSGFYGNSETTGHVHENEYDYKSSYSQQLEWLQKDLGLSESEAEDMIDSFQSFTGGGYSGIRADQFYGNADSPGYQKGEQLESFIQKSPKYYNQGPIYRGIDVPEATANQILDTLSNGGAIDMRGTASWSSDFKTAKSFSNAEWNEGSSDKSFVFVLPEGTKMGASIQHLSKFGKAENEVLVSKLAKYRATKIEMDSDHGYYLIHVTEGMR